MALITDGQINTPADLRWYENSILDTASSEGIELNTKLLLAERELEVEVGRWLERECFDSGIGLGNVVVTEPLRQWHALHALALVFRDAYHQQLNDRFRGKWAEYARLSAGASVALFERGLGIVTRPISRADRPTVNVAPGALPAACYYVRVAWTNQFGEVGAPSETVTLEVPDGSVIEVRPTGQPDGASGWNVYVALTEDGPTQQNPSPIEPDAAWVLASSGLTAGKAPAQGQAPEYFMKTRRVLPRG